MNGESAVWRQPNRVVGKHMTVSDDDRDFRFQGAQLIENVVTPWALGLEYGDPFFLGDALHWWGHERAVVTSVRRVGLRHHADDILSLA